MRGCLVIIWFGILFLCVQNCAERNEALKAAPAGSAVKHRAVSIAREADLTGAYGSAKAGVSDMRKGLTEFSVNLGAAVKSVPAQNILEESQSDLTFIQAPRVTEAVCALPEIDFEVADESGSTSAVPPVISEEETVITEDSPIIEEIDVPEENMIPEEPADTENTVFPEEINGFILDSEGYITGYTEQINIGDGLLFIPESANCVGIRSGAIDGLGESITEVYLSANITDIEAGVFDGFPYLMFVEVSGDNSCYYSENGILYSISGEEIFCPYGRIIE